MSDVEVASVPKAPKVKKPVPAAEGDDVSPPGAPEDVTAMFDLSKKKKKKKVKKEVCVWVDFVRMLLCVASMGRMADRVCVAMPVCPLTEEGR